jgi:uncharacterized protein (DUF2141 family)
VTFNVYGSSSCSGPPLFTSTNAVSTAAGVTTATSASFAPTTTGSYYVVATYSGSASYNSVTTPCGAPNETEVVSPAPPGISSAVAPASIGLGQTFTDTATLTGAAGAAAPTGIVGFSVYDNVTCSGAPVFVSNGNSLSTSAGVTKATSAAFLPTGLGDYFVVATYSGDANYTAVTSSCGAPGETEVVGPGTVAVSTQVTPATISWGSGPFHDVATLSVPAGVPAPTGTVTFNVYGPSNPTCGSTAFLTSTVSVVTSGGVSTATSGNFTPTRPGTYRVTAAYSGSGNYKAVTTACGAAGESEVVTPAVAQIATQVTPATIVFGSGPFHDVATLTAPSGVPAPTGTVTFKVYGPSNPTCGSTAFLTSTVSLVTSGGVTKATSGNFTPTRPGTYRVVASFSSGDSNYVGGSTACGAPGESEVVTPATAAIAAQVAPATVAVGASFHDVATLTPPSGLPAPTGTVKFSVYGPSNTTCTSTPFETSTVSVVTSGGVTTATSGGFVPSRPGTWRVVASYGGDANYGSSATACSAPGGAEVVTPVAAQIAEQVAPATVTLGTSFDDVATLTVPSGAITPTGTVTFQVFGPSNSTCSGSPAFTSTESVNTSGKATSAQFTPTALGTYLVVASYSGDSDYGVVSTACGAAGGTEVVTAGTSLL